MKKLISLFLAFAMVASFAITAFAEENVGTGGYSTDVTGSYVAGTTAGGTVFSVDITWKDMSFIYHAAKEPVWNAETHTYSEEVPAYWEGEGTITVTNHSNAKISAKPSYTPAEGYSAASMVFSTENLKIASAENGEAQIGTITVTPSGSLPAMDEAKTIGSITVTIAQDNDITVAEAQALIAKMEELLGVATGDADPTELNYNKGKLQDAVDAYNSDGDQQALNTAYATALGVYDRIKAKYPS